MSGKAMQLIAILGTPREEDTEHATLNVSTHVETATINTANYFSTL